MSASKAFQSNTVIRVSERVAREIHNIIIGYFEVFVEVMRNVRFSSAGRHKSAFTTGIGHSNTDASIHARNARTAEHNANLIERLESQLSHWSFSYSAGIHSIRTHLFGRVQHVIAAARVNA